MISVEDFRLLRPQNIWDNCHPDDCFNPEENCREIEFMLGSEHTCILRSVAAEFHYSRKSPYWLEFVETFIRGTKQKSIGKGDPFELFLQRVGILPGVDIIQLMEFSSEYWAVLEKIHSREKALIFQVSDLLWNVFLVDDEVEGVSIEDPEFFGRHGDKAFDSFDYLSNGRSVWDSCQKFLNSGNFSMATKADSLHAPQ